MSNYLTIIGNAFRCYTCQRRADMRFKSENVNQRLRGKTICQLGNAVVTSFGVNGIPTKFVVDGTGKIRFKAVGFNGNDQELVDELSTMIELAGGGLRREKPLILKTLLQAFS